jgi:UDP-glucose 4-epimerase
MESEKIKPRRCSVTGATGVVGVPLVNQLLNAGHHVRVLARSAVPSTLFPESVEIVQGDLADKSAVKKVVDGADWIFHLAAKLHISNPDEKLRDEYERTNVAATNNLLDLAKINNAEKFIFFSTINVYGASKTGEIFDESSPTNPIGFYGESKAEAEKLVQAARNLDGKQFGVCLRLAAVYGSRMKGNYLRLLDAVRRRRFFFIGNGANRRTTIHQWDAAAAALLAAEKAEGGSIYNATDGEIHTLAEIVKAMSNSLGKDKPKFRLPIAPVRFGVRAVEDLGKFFGVQTPVNRSLLEKFLEDVAVSGDKIKRELGFRPQFDLNAGWNETVSNVRLTIAD